MSQDAMLLAFFLSMLLNAVLAIALFYVWFRSLRLAGQLKYGEGQDWDEFQTPFMVSHVTGFIDDQEVVVTVTDPDEAEKLTWSK